MYKFTGGFINTLQPFNNDLYNKKLIMTSEFLDYVRQTLTSLRELPTYATEKEKFNNYIYNISKSIISDENILQYIIFCNENNYDLYTLNDEQLLESGIMKDKFKLINNNNLFIKVYEVRKKIIFISNINNTVTQLKKITDRKIFDGQIAEKNKLLISLEKKINDLLKINCFYDNQNCVDIISDKTKKSENLIEYIGNTFGYYNYEDKFNKFEIKKYVILKKLQDLDTYYIIHNNCDTYSECRFFILNNNLSLHEAHITLDKIINLQSTQQFYYKNTEVNNIVRGKMYRSDLLNITNKIIKNNIPEEYLNISLIRDIFDILYRFNYQTTEYMTDIIKKYDNIVFYLACINKIHLIYQFLDTDIEPTSDLFQDIKEDICYSYNYYIYLSKLVNISHTEQTINNINSYLTMTKNEVFEEFIFNVKELCIKLKNLKTVCNDSGILAKDILSNFLDKLFNTENLPLPINKEEILKSLGIVIKEFISEEEKELYMNTLVPLDRVYNYTSDFYIFNYERIKYESDEFPNCGENTLFHMINLLLTHTFIDGRFKFNKNFININKLKKQDDTESDLYKFYKNFADYNDLINKYRKSLEIKTNFASIFYRREKIPTEPKIYRIKDICEINPSEENIIKLLNIILEKNFSNILEFIKYFYPEHNINYQENTPEQKKIILDKYVITLDYRHASIENIEQLAGTLDIYELLFESFEKGLTFRNKLLIYTNTLNKYLQNFVITLLEIDDKNIINDLMEKILAIKDDQVRLNLLNFQNIAGNTALHYATFKILENIVRILIEKGADVTLKDNNGNTALHFASGSKLENIAIAKMLIERGADVNLQNKIGNTILLSAIKKLSGYITPTILEDNFVRMLIEKGADVNLQDDNGNTALTFAIGKNFGNISKMLIERGAVFNLHDSNGITPFNLAISHNLKNIVGMLIERGANLNLQDRNTGNAPLHIATMTYLENISKILIERGANINLQNSDGNTPLHLAIKLYLDNIANILIEKEGINLNLQNSDGKTPLDLAKEYNLRSIIKKITEKLSQQQVGGFMSSIDYYTKYLKYKQKYIKLKYLKN
jgi:ankyrin repeat protein